MKFRLFERQVIIKWLKAGMELFHNTEAFHRHEESDISAVSTKSTYNNPHEFWGGFGVCAAPQPAGSRPPPVADPRWVRTKQMSGDPAASIGHTAQGQL